MLEAVVAIVPTTWLQFALLLLTVVAYFVARWAYIRSNSHPLLIPILTAVVGIVAVLIAVDIPYADYAASIGLLQIIIGPATVALAVPLYMQLPQLKAMWLPLTTALLAGGVVAVVSTLVIAWAFGASPTMLISLAPKSATMHIAMPASEAVGWFGSLVAVSVAVTGITGVLIGGPLFRWVGAQHDEVTQGFTLGLTSHSIGVARCVQISQPAAAAAALAMGLNGLLTALIIPFVPWALRLAGIA